MWHVFTIRRKCNNKKINRATRDNEPLVVTSIFSKRLRPTKDCGGRRRRHHVLFMSDRQRARKRSRIKCQKRFSRSVCLLKKKDLLSLLAVVSTQTNGTASHHRVSESFHLVLPEFPKIKILSNKQAPPTHHLQSHNIPSTFILSLF
jgi:hypothetical protein